MKVVAALALGCLLAAVAFALAPAQVAAPHEPEVATSQPAPMTEAPDLAVEAPGRAAPAQPLVPVGAPEPDLSESPDTVTLKGRVTVSSGAQPPVHLVIEREGCPDVGTDGSDCQRIESDADEQTGEFSVAVPPGAWRMVARADGYLPAAEAGLVLTAGEQLGDVLMLLERGAGISGRVTIEGEPAATVRVTAESPTFVRRTVTDELGRFELTGLPEGRYTVRAYADFSGGDEKTVVAGDHVDLALGHREKIRGRVLDERGFPAEGVAMYSDFSAVVVPDRDPFPVSRDGELMGVSMHGCSQSPACYERAITGPDGRFELEAAPGETLIVAAVRGEQVAVHDQLVASDAPLELTLKTGLRLRLVDDKGAALPGANVDLYPQASFLKQPIKTDDEGWLTLPGDGHLMLGLPQGSHLVGEVPRRVQINPAIRVDPVVRPPWTAPTGLD